MDYATMLALRTEQVECDDFVLTDRRLTLMKDVHAGDVRLTNGVDVLDADASEMQPLGHRVRVLWAGGMAVLDPTRTWRLTPAGVRRAGAALTAAAAR